MSKKKVDEWMPREGQKDELATFWMQCAINTARKRGWIKLEYDYFIYILQTLDELVDDEVCEYDHHGNCQCHGWINKEPGYKPICMNEKGKAILGLFKEPVYKEGG